MTAKMFSAFDYGMHEMSGLYRRHASIALAVAIVFHVILISIFSLISPLVPEKYIPKGFPPSHDRRIIVGIPPFVTGSPIVKTRPVPVSSHKVGIPVPVPIDELTIKDEILEPSETQVPITGIAGEENDGTSSGGEGTYGVSGEETEPLSDRITIVEQLPVPVKQVNPEYPIVARLAGVEGTVWLKVLIDKQGKPKKAMVWKSDAEVFDEAAMKAALQWAFTPAMMNSGPVAVWVSIPFRFKLKN